MTSGDKLSLVGVSGQCDATQAQRHVVFNLPESSGTARGLGPRTIASLRKAPEMFCGLENVARLSVSAARKCGVGSILDEV